MRSRARLSPRHQDMVREKIRTIQLIRTLQAFALDEELRSTVGKVEMTRERLKAIEILLRKSLPDLSNVTVSGDPSNPLEKSITVRFE